jgi:hypothetical protein
MGVYLCLGQPIYHLTREDSVDISFFKSFKAIHDYIEENSKVLIYMGEGQHKIKKKAEQVACNEDISSIDSQLICD